MEPLGTQPAGELQRLPKTILPGQRRAVRQKVHTPAYASLQGLSGDKVLDLCEILDISERGALLQTPSTLKLGGALDLLLDFSETNTKVHTKGEVVWSDAAGRVGVRFPELTDDARHQLQEWLFLNVMVAAAGHAVGLPSATAARTPSALPLPEAMLVPEPEIVPSEFAEPSRADYTTTLTALGAVQREVEGLGPRLDRVLQLVADRAKTLTLANGAAVAVEDGTRLICRGSSGAAPPVGTTLDVGSGISGRCVQAGILQRCDDAERDPRVDRETCRELDIRSILAVPIRLGERVIGLVEAFSSRPNAFGDLDASVMQRLGETILAAINRASRGGEAGRESEGPPGPANGAQSSMLFASLAEPDLENGEMSFLRRHLMVLVAVAVLILVALAYVLVPRISGLLTSSRPAPASPAATLQPTPVRADLAALPETEQIRQRAEQGDPYAEFALATHYATGEDVAQDYSIASRWFLKAAEQGMVIAQDQLGAYYWAGRGVPKDVVKAYFWSVLAREGGNQASQVRVQFLSPQLTREQAQAIQRQADEFFKQHPPLPKITTQ